MFGQGFVTLPYLTHEMPADVFAAWSAYVVEWDRLADKRKEKAEHEAAMDAARKALRK